MNTSEVPDTGLHCAGNTMVNEILGTCPSEAEVFLTVFLNKGICGGKQGLDSQAPLPKHTILP